MPFTPRLYYHPTLPSTMDEARRMAHANVAEGAVIQAGSQSAGRGRFGNQWSSPLGNLYMTIVLRPSVPQAFWGQSSFVMAVALADTLAQIGTPKNQIQLKWPNDVLVEGKKIAGILLEMESTFLLAGMGINIALAPDGGTKLGSITTPDNFRDILLENIITLYEYWQKDGFKKIRESWLEQAYGIGLSITARMANRQEMGLFYGIDAQGNLLLQDAAQKIILISSGAVHFNTK